MPNYSKIILMGHLGRDPETRAVGDSEVCNFSIAVNNPFKKDDPAVWYRIAAWGKRGDACQRFLTKGNAVYVEGRLDPREYESGGETKTSLDVRADVVEFLGGKDGGAGGGSDREEPRDLRPKVDPDEPLPF